MTLDACSAASPPSPAAQGSLRGTSRALGPPCRRIESRFLLDLLSQPSDERINCLSSGTFAAEMDEESATRDDRFWAKRSAQHAVADMLRYMRQHADRHPAALHRCDHKLIVLRKVKRAGCPHARDAESVEPELPFGGASPITNALVVKTNVVC